MIRRSGYIPSFSGMIGDVIEGRADMALSQFGVTKERSLYIEYTTYLRSTAYVIVGKDLPPSFSTTLFKPFSYSMWLCWLMAIIGVFIFCVSILIVNGYRGW